MKRTKAPGRETPTTIECGSGELAEVLATRVELAHDDSWASLTIYAKDTTCEPTIRGTPAGLRRIAHSIMNGLRRERTPAHRKEG